MPTRLWFTELKMKFTLEVAEVCTSQECSSPAGKQIRQFFLTMAGKTDDPFEHLLNMYRNISEMCVLHCISKRRPGTPRRGEVLCVEYCIADEMQYLRKSTINKLPNYKKV
ncbi:uncharacterized protein LOC126299252 [Schistocerca gregaria]|uniref:uncharacterized protein LOC126299252 n=1 Tax=Schistocerca gregaria TaxID=7010 RepID=UPI00211DDB7C|nr:uncharacterized protein LOC126299252 [Schistocerca gregaria]